MKKIMLTLIITLIAVSTSFASLVGQKAPAIQAEKWLNASGPVSIDQFKDKVLVVEFWATWCPPCRKAIPHLVKLYNKNKDKGLVVIGITNESADKIKSFVKEYKMNYIVGAGSRSAEGYQVRGIPHAFVIINGRILWEGHPMGGLDQVVEKALEDMAQKAEPKKEVKKEVKKVEAVTKATK